MLLSKVENGVDAFKDVFKLYKRRDRPLDLSKVVDFGRPEQWNDRIQEIKVVDLGADGEIQLAELIDVSEWRIFKLLPDSKSPAGAGIFCIRNPFTDSGMES